VTKSSQRRNYQLDFVSAEPDALTTLQDKNAMSRKF